MYRHRPFLFLFCHCGCPNRSRRRRKSRTGLVLRRRYGTPVTTFRYGQYVESPPRVGNAQVFQSFTKSLSIHKASPPIRFPTQNRIRASDPVPKTDVVPRHKLHTAISPVAGTWTGGLVSRTRFFVPKNDSQLKRNFHPTD